MPTRMTGSGSPLALAPAPTHSSPARTESKVVRTIRIRPHIRVRGEFPSPRPVNVRLGRHRHEAGPIPRSVLRDRGNEAFLERRTAAGDDAGRPAGNSGRAQQL